MPWPAQGDGLVELAPAVLEAVKMADPDESDNVLRHLRHTVEAFLSDPAEPTDRGA